MFIFNLFRGEDLKDKKKEFKTCNDKYLKVGESISSDSVTLFECRKESVRNIQRVKSYIDRLNNCPKDIHKGIEKAMSYTYNFKETMQWEIEAKQSYNNASVSAGDSNAKKIGIGGIAAGSAIATMGPTAAMAIATTFGSASTGVAISSLGGIAATNAALAWLGGGAVAAGGAGIAGGTVLLALAGPIGWGLASVAALGTTYKMRSSNTKAIEEIDRLIHDINQKLDILKPKHEKLTNLISATKKLNESVELDLFLSSPNDFASDNFPKEKLYDIVSNCKTLGKMINDTIEMQMD